MAEEKGLSARFKKFLRNLVRIKPPEEMLEQASKAGLEKSLNAWDLIILGIGVIIGSGIFAVVGRPRTSSTQ